MNLLRYPDLNLPIYDASAQIARNKTEIRKQVGSGASTFLRAVRLIYPQDTTDLANFLELADRTFEDAAEFCGGVVVDHSFALYRPERTSQIPVGSIDFGRLVPKGYELIANVKVVPDATSIDCYQLDGMRKIVYDYYSSNRETVYTDLNPYQFVIGSASEVPIFVDIEPKIEIRDPYRNW